LPGQTVSGFSSRGAHSKRNRSTGYQELCEVWLLRISAAAQQAIAPVFLSREQKHTFYFFKLDNYSLESAKVLRKTHGF
jgi:hypothetical protein